MKKIIACMLILITTSVFGDEIETPNNKYSITVPDNWVSLPSKNPIVKLMVNKETRENAVLTQLPNPGSIDVTKTDLSGDIKMSLNAEQELLEKEAYINKNGLNFTIYPTARGKDNESIGFIVFYSDNESIYRLIIVLKNDRETKSKLNRILDNIKKEI